jgi:hypothetical protein
MKVTSEETTTERAVPRNQPEICSGCCDLEHPSATGQITFRPESTVWGRSSETYVDGPPPSDAGLVREAWRLAERDAALGQWPKDWPDDERERWKEDIDRYGDLMEVYRLARRPEELKAPPLWPDALVGIVAGALIAARVAEASETREQVWRAAPDLAVAAFERA